MAGGLGERSYLESAHIWFGLKVTHITSAYSLLTRANYTPSFEGGLTCSLLCTWRRGDLKVSASNLSDFKISFIHSFIHPSNKAILNAILDPMGDTGTYKIYSPSKSGDTILQAGKGEV